MNVTQVEENLKQQAEGGFKNTRFFALKEDKEVARVRFLFKTAQDAEFIQVHSVRLKSAKGKDYSIDVDCLGKGCPLCQEAFNHTEEKFPLVSKCKDTIYMPLINYDHYDEEKKDYVPTLEVWKRSSRFYKDTLSSYGARYSPLYGKITEVERNGAKGDIKTTFALFPCDNDRDGNPYEKVEDLAKLKEKFEVDDTVIYGGTASLVKTWTEEQCQQFIETNEYPKSAKSDDEKEEKQDTAPRPRTRTRVADEEVPF